MSEPTSQPPFDDASLPAGLAADLSALYGHSVNVPPAVDAAIETAARRRAAQVRRMRVVFRWGAAVAAAAAVVLMTVAVWPARSPVFHPTGQVTILDAFSLARQLKAGRKIDKSWDVNGDGVIDRSDVELLANRAVQLPKGGPP
jgi:hypothetical protein